MSQFEMEVAKNRTKRPIEAHLVNQASRKLKTDDDLIKYSVYYRYMKHWLKYFPLQQFLIIDNQDLIKDPLGVTTRVEKFLGLQHKINAEKIVYDHQRGFYCMKLHPETSRICMARVKGRYHPSLGPTLEKELREYFAPFNRKFYKLVGRDFGWPE